MIHQKIHIKTEFWIFMLVCLIINLPTLSISQNWGPLTEDIRVDESPPKSWGAHKPAIAVNPEHLHYMIAWSDEVDQGLTRVYGCIFDPNGNPATKEFQIDQCFDKISSVSGPIDIAIDPYGNFWVVWEDSRAQPDVKIYGRVFDLTGSPLSDEFIVDTGFETGGVTRQPAIAISPNNTILIAWVDDVNGQTSIGCCFMQIVSATEFTLLNSLIVNEGNIRNFKFASGPQIAVTPDGDFVVTWRDNRYEYQPNQGVNMIYARRFRYSGKALSPEFLVNQYIPKTYISYSDPDVTVDQNNNMIFTWNDGRDYSRLSNYYTFFRKFAWDEAPLTDDIKVGVCNTLDEPRIAVDQDNKFTIIYTQRSYSKADPDTAFDHLYAKQFSSKNDSIGPAWIIDQGGTIQYNTEHAHVINSTNLLITTWTTNRLTMPQETFTGYVYMNIYGIPLPVPPSDFKAETVETTKILWTWLDNSDIETYFLIKDENNSEISPYISPNTESWEETGLSPNQLVRRRIIAANISGESTPSSLISVYTLATTPSKLQAISISDSTIELIWYSENATRFAVEKAPDNDGQPGRFTFIATWEDNLTQATFRDAAVQPITAYWYRVSSYNGDQVITSPTEQIKVVTGDAVMLPPSDLVGAPKSPAMILWEWQDNSNNEKCFYLEDSAGKRISDSLSANSISWLETKLNANTLYSRRVRGVSTTGLLSEPSDIYSACTLADLPTDLTVINTTSTTIVLRWRSSSAARFAIDRALDMGGVPGEWTILENWDSNWKLFGYIDSSLTVNTTYWYRVRSYNQQGEINDEGAVVKAATLAFAGPSHFKGTAISPDSIEWTWQDNTDEEIAYIIFSEKGDSTWLPANSDAWLETKLSANTQYIRYVLAIAADGRMSHPSNFDSVYTFATAPANLRTADITSTSATLLWNCAAATCFAIERAIVIQEVNQGWIPVIQWEDNFADTIFVDAGLSPNTTYAYRVMSYNGDKILTAPGNEVTLTTLTSIIAPPTELTGAAVSATEIEWNWKDNTGFEIKYLVTDSTGTPISELPSNQTSWIESGLSVNTRYVRQVFAVSESGEKSGGSNYAGVYTLAIVPTNLRAIDSTSTSVTLQWQGYRASRFYIERTSSIQEIIVIWTPVIQWEDNLTDTIFVDTGLSPNTTYAYRVMSYNCAKILTAPGNEVTVTTPSSVIAPPTELTGAAASTTEIQWNWKDNTDLEINYLVTDSTGTPISELPSNQTSLIETGLSVNTRYVRQVFAVSESGENSGGSNYVSVYTLAEAPADLSVARFQSIANLSWDGHGGTRFAIERAIDYEGEPGDWQYIAQWETAVTDSHFTDIALDSSLSYWYQVRAYNGDQIITESCLPFLTHPQQTGPAKGDIVYDTEINLADLNRLVEIILEQGPTVTQYETMTADCYEDGQINIHDIIWLVNKILNIPMVFDGSASSPDDGNAVIELAGTTFNAAGESTIPVKLRNSTPLNALQIQFDLDEHIKIDKIKLTPQINGMALSSLQTGKQLRLIIYSMNGSALNPGETELLSLLVTPESEKNGAVDLEISAAGGIDENGKLTKLSISNGSFTVLNTQIPGQFRLNQNFPNPFNAGTEISFQCPENAGKISLKIFDLMGHEITALLNARPSAGTIRVHWNGKDKNKRDVASGVYFYQLDAAGFHAVKKLLLIR